MLANSPVGAFSATANPEAALRFYRDVLGLRFAGDDGFALVFDAAGTSLRVAKVEQVVPAPYTILGWEVADIESAVGSLAANGVVFERYEGMAQDELGIWAIGPGKVAWFKDPDGNTLSLTQKL